MIQEDYVSCELAKLLKKKGFNEPCVYNYWDDNNLLMSASGLPVTNDSYIGDRCSAPTLYLAMKWLREEKELLISILPTIDKDGYACLMYYLWDLADIYKDAIKSGLYSVESYEECVDDAIKKCMELI